MAGGTSLANEASSIITQRLDAGEKLIWSGQPRRGFLLHKSDIILIPFSLMFGGFAIFWEFGVLSIPNNERATRLLFALFGVPFVLIGLYAMVGRFIVDAVQRENTFYGITDRRILIVTGTPYRLPFSYSRNPLVLRIGLFGTRVRSLELRNAGIISMLENSDGSGSITFGPEDPYRSITTFPLPGFNRRLSPCFDALDDVKLVYDKVRQSLESAP